MNRQTFERPPRWWSPKLSPGWIRFWRPFRKWEQRRKHRLVQTEVHGAEGVRRALDAGHGVLVTPNHCSHADCFALYEAADRVESPFYAMMAWQVFSRGSWLRQTILQQHGGFSVDREGTDLTALRQARDILEHEPYPLAIFPEGEVYHLNERLTPFRDGPAAIALMAAKKGKRSVACVPCAIRYYYVEDPTEALTRLMDRLEQSLHWRPRRDMTLPQRIYRIAEGTLALKEIEMLGHTQSGTLPERIGSFIEMILARVKLKHALPSEGLSIPERVKAARHAAIACLEQRPDDSDLRRQMAEDLDDLFLVVQAFSYPGDYVREKPSIERIAETLDKYEEDLLEMATATVRGTRRVVVKLGDPVILHQSSQPIMTARELTIELQRRVASMLKGPGIAETEKGVL